MSQLVIFHNPNCSKSRGAFEILNESNLRFDVVEYLDSPPDQATLERIVDLIPDEPSELIRDDSNAKALGIASTDYLSKDEVVNLLLKHPQLMQRPVVVRGDQAIIARPSEKVRELL